MTEKLTSADGGWSIVINPGTGPVPGASEAHAVDNMHAFVADLNTLKGLAVDGFTRTPALDDGDGRFAFDVAFADGRIEEIEMPGLPVERVRWMKEPRQDIWDFPRLYVGGSSWVWMFALSACEPPEDEE